MREAINKITNLPQIADLSKELIIMGDFNLPNCTWNIQGNMVTGKTCAKGNIIQNMTDTLLLSQQVHSPTRNENTLDLIFTNNSQLINEIRITPTIHSDHNIISIPTNIKLQETENRNQCSMPFSDINLNKTDWNSVNNKLNNINWEEELSEQDTKSCWKTIEKHLTKILYTFSPKKVPLHGKKKISIEHRLRRKLMRQRTKVEKKLNPNSRCPNRHAAYQNKILELERKIKASHEKENKELEKKAVESIKSNSKFFFNYAKKKTTISNSIGPLITTDGQSLTTSPQEMANILQSQYVKAWSVPSPPENNPDYQGTSSKAFSTAGHK